MCVSGCCLQEIQNSAHYIWEGAQQADRVERVWLYGVVLCKRQTYNNGENEWRKEKKIVCELKLKKYKCRQIYIYIIRTEIEEEKRREYHLLLETYIDR